MRQTVIENPIINRPFEEPARHFQFSEDGITNVIVEERRKSAYFIPIAQPRKRDRSGQIRFDTEWTEDRLRENDRINRIRARVANWRRDGHRGVARVTRMLLEYWTNPERERKLFFCQIEAVETAIYITEAAALYGDGWIEAELRTGIEESGSSLRRIAFKMATGSGKTVVMAMLICWQALNKAANPQDSRFSDTFLVVTPGITIRDRLRVLLPSDPQNFYRVRDLLPPGIRQEIGKAKILITNFHAFKLRERADVSRLAKKVLARDAASPLTETPDRMARRVCREFGGKKNIVVISDEAHHCYRHKPASEKGRLSPEDRKEIEKREEEARIWISGLEAVQAKFGLRAVFDLSATPFFLRGSGYPEGTLFPWVVSDFSLIDAIECGIVKIPRVPVSDDQMTAALPTYRDLWPHVREHLPRKGRGTAAVVGEPRLPKELEGALHSLYSNYDKSYREWEQNGEKKAQSGTPPVFIVVCNNTNVSKLIYDYISGWKKEADGGKAAIVPGALPLFSNVENGAWTARPNTILIDSEQLESGEAMSADFKKIVAAEIEEFKAEYRQRFPGRDVEALTDEDLLREVLNTVGKPGRLGEQVRCVVSVSMLSEGWDANTVTHILGVRAFGTQLLCEQVVGRGLRRMSYAVNPDGFLEPEYAEVYGVPFSFIPCSGSGGGRKEERKVTHVHALEERAVCEITFPRLQGYRFDLPREELSARFGEDSRLVLSAAELPLKVRLDPIVGESSLHTLDDLRQRRLQEVAFLLAKLVLETHFRGGQDNIRPWLFPQLLSIARRWIAECVVCKDNAFPQMLIIVEFARTAAERIYRAIVQSSRGEKTLKPILYPYDTIGSTRHVSFDTSRPVFATDPRFCHISHVVADTNIWEQKMAEALEELGEEGLVIAYVKNQNLGFTIPYTLDGEERSYYPDYIVRIDDGESEPLNLIVEVTGEKKKDKDEKAATARTLWVPAVNHHGRFGRWAFLEINDPWNGKNAVREAIGRKKKAVGEAEGHADGQGSVR
jgi:type III restriction enzyme